MSEYPQMYPVPISKRSRKEDICIQFGRTRYWHLYTAPKQFTIVGSIRRGLNSGLLAIAPDGKYVRVNGSYIEPIDGRTMKFVQAQIIQRTVQQNLVGARPPDFRTYVRKTLSLPKRSEALA